MIRTFFRTIFIFLLLVAWKVPGFADSSGRIKEATKAFRSGDYLKAAEGFQEAEQASPNDLRISFNHGSSLAAAGKFDEAVEILKKSALSPDKKIASDSLNLLGQIAVDQVRQLLSDPPEATPPEQHAEIFEKLQIAEQYYSEAISVAPKNSASQSAVELIRAWRTRIAKLWDLAERKKKRQSDVLERLHWLENWQEELARGIVKESIEPNSPKKFQNLYRSAENQNHLTDEFAALQSDFQKELDQSRSEQNQPGNSSKIDENSDSDNRALELIIEELQRLKESSETARHQLRSFQTDAARQTVEENFSRLNRLRMNLAPFEMIVREAEQLQEKLCNETSESEKKGKTTEDHMEQIDGQKLDPMEQAARQRRIERWMPLMVFRAKESLQHLEENGLSPQGLPEEQNKPFDLAVKYGPEIQKLAQNAAGKLQAVQYSEALPDQEEALRLLREILQTTNEQNQQQQNQDNNQQDRKQQNQDQNKQDQQDQQSPNGQGQQTEDKSRQDAQDKNEQQQTEKDVKGDEQQQGEKKSDDKNNQDSSNQQGNRPQKSEQLEPQSDWDSKDDSSQQNKSKQDVELGQETELNKERQKDVEKAERMLRQVRRKQQEANEKRERVRSILRRLESVEKDW